MKQVFEPRKRSFRISKHSADPNQEKIRNIMEQKIGKVTTFFPKTKIEKIQDKNPEPPEQLELEKRNSAARANLIQTSK